LAEPTSSRGHRRVRVSIAGIGGTRPLSEATGRSTSHVSSSPRFRATRTPSRSSSCSDPTSVTAPVDLARRRSYPAPRSPTTASRRTCGTCPSQRRHPGDDLHRRTASLLFHQTRGLTCGSTLDGNPGKGTRKDTNTAAADLVHLEPTEGATTLPLTAHRRKADCSSSTPPLSEGPRSWRVPLRRRTWWPGAQRRQAPGRSGTLVDPTGSGRRPHVRRHGGRERDPSEEPLRNTDGVTAWRPTASPTPGRCYRRQLWAIGSGCGGSIRRVGRRRLLGPSALPPHGSRETLWNGPRPVSVLRVRRRAVGGPAGTGSRDRPRRPPVGLYGRPEVAPAAATADVAIVSGCARSPAGDAPRAGLLA